jgi:hypothetical protein
MSDSFPLSGSPGRIGQRKRRRAGHENRGFASRTAHKEQAPWQRALTLTHENRQKHILER